MAAAWAMLVVVALPLAAATRIRRIETAITHEFGFLLAMDVARLRVQIEPSGGGGKTPAVITLIIAPPPHQAPLIAPHGALPHTHLPRPKLAGEGRRVTRVWSAPEESLSAMDAAELVYRLAAG